MTRTLIISLLGAASLAACASAPQPEAEVVRQETAPRPVLTSVNIDGRQARSLADALSARKIAMIASSEAAAAFEGDNKGNACFQDPMFTGIGGGDFDTSIARREEFWTYTVCGEAYEVPVIVTKQSGSETVAFTVGSGREAR